MAKFNQPKTIEQKVRSRPDATVNKEGDLAFKLTPQVELYTTVASWLVGEPKFYDPKSRDTIVRVHHLVDRLAETDPKFVLQMAAYARKELYLRSAPIYLLARACQNPEIKEFVPEYAPKIVKRADEICETLGAYSAMNPGKNICRALRRGLDKSLRQFDEYQLAKYDRKGDWNLRDAFRVIRPKPSCVEEEELWGRLVKRQLKTPDTWEVAVGTDGISKEAWEKALPNMGFMAILRNLKNFLKYKVDLTIPIATLTNENLVKKSKQFPYRFFSAYKAIASDHYPNMSPDVTRLLDAVEDALVASVANIPTLKGTTFVVCDESGSMSAPVSDKSEVRCIEIANLFGALSFGFCERAYVAGFGDYVKTVALSKRASIFDNMVKIQESSPGYSTQGWRIPEFLIENKVDVDRIMVFTDMQMYDSIGYGYGVRGYGVRGSNTKTFAGGIGKYRSQVGHPVWCYFFDLKGYGTGQTPKDDKHTYLMAGWSDKIFNFIQRFEESPNVVIDSIKENY